MKYLEKLIKTAKQASKLAYAPYSQFKVGSALLTKSNKIYSGANIENASYGLTICAERVAIFKAISEGEKEFKAMAIYTKTKDFTMPCGACRQVLNEFSPKIDLILINAAGKIKRTKLTKLLPHPFK
ncbi:MAG: cytidine deaminase [candidate division WOR-3 bacterium]|nr:cytidine deaminase [candidate division WOR-3 bacterium]